MYGLVLGEVSVMMLDPIRRLTIVQTELDRKSISIHEHIYTVLYKEN